MYHNGRGVPQDNVYAYMWWSITASNGSDTREIEICSLKDDQRPNCEGTETRERVREERQQRLLITKL